MDLPFLYGNVSMLNGTIQTSDKIVSIANDFTNHSLSATNDYSLHNDGCTRYTLHNVKDLDCS